jgi:hypothetical protein
MAVNSALALFVGDWQSARSHIDSGLERIPTESRLLSNLLRIETVLGNQEAATETYAKLSGGSGYSTSQADWDPRSICYGQPAAQSP